MSRAAVLFAQGLEECEGLIVVDLLSESENRNRHRFAGWKGRDHQLS